MFAPNVGRYPSQQIQCDNGRYARSPPITVVGVVVGVLVAVVTLVVRRRAAAASATVRRGHGSAIPTRRRAA